MSLSRNRDRLPLTLRIAKRLRKHWDFLFIFLDKPEVPFDNNLAKRAIRPVVILW
ncbi:MAG: transposase [Planctomycetota bacterium]